MPYTVSKEFKQKYKSYSFYFQLWFLDGKRFVCYEDFDELPKRFPSNLRNEHVSYIELDEVLFAVQTLSDQFDAAKLKPPRLLIQVYNRKDAVCLEEYEVQSCV